MDTQAFELLMDKLRESDRRLSDMDEKLDELLAFKWKIIGGSVVLSVLFNLAISVFTQGR